MNRLGLALLSVVLLAGSVFADDFPGPDFSQIRLERSHSLDPDKPHWIDATSIFQKMAEEAANRFKPVVRRKPREGVPIGGEESFWTVNIATNQFVQVPAILKKIGKHCYVYLEKGRELDQETIDSIAKEFDNRIYAIDTATFGSEPNPGIDGDERITLLLLDIQDGWEPGKGYVAGYFFPLNEYSTKDFPQSNEREMFYLDINPADPKSPDYMGVIAHEFQHMIHWNHDPKEDKWINEGMSQFAFRACGYDHPSQIVAFAQRPDHTLPAWKNTIDDYGAVYLFFYYLISKYDSTSSRFPTALVANPGKSIEGLNSALKEVGIKTDFAALFADWSIANILSDPKIAGGKYGYDETIPVKVLAKTVDPRNGNLAIQEKVNGWACDYYDCNTVPFWAPEAPTIADVVEVPLKGGGFVFWSVDDGVAPPEALWPANTKVYDPGKMVRTKVTGDSFKVGPFKNNPIKSLNLSIYNNKLIPINHAQIKIGSEKAHLVPISGTLTFKVKGKKGSVFGPKDGFNVRLVTIGETTEVKNVALDKDWAGEAKIEGLGTKIKRAILVVGNTNEKEISYELSTAYQPDPTFAHLLAALEKGETLKNLTQPEVAAQNKTLEPLYMSVISDMNTISEQAADALDSKKNPEALANAELLAEKGNKPAFETLFKLVDEKMAFSAQHGEPWKDEISKEIGKVRKAPLKDSGDADRVSPQSKRGDDSDTSHTNIGYLCKKKQELIHSLTHLKIDPKFLEGQILQMYKLLQINLNLPNIPFPDGLAIVDYDEKAAQEYIDRLNQGATQEEKESLRRLTIFEDLIELVYNDNLTMAEDFGLCVYEAFRLILSGRATLISIAGGLQDVPVVGPLTKKVVHVIIAKSINIVIRVTNLLAVKFKPPYNAIVPIVVQVGGSIAARILHVQVNDNDKWMLPWAAKTASKYAFTSIPKIGYVARTQTFINTSVDAAVKNDFSGTYEEAKKGVLDDGDPSVKKSVYEIFSDIINRKHDFTMKEIEVAKIAKAVAQIAAYASVIDPTNISKVVGIVAASFSGGALVHGMVNSILTFSKAPEFLEDGLKISFHPDKPITPKKTVVPKQAVPSGKLGGALKIAATLQADYKGLMKQVNEALEKKDLKELTQLTGNLVAFEETFGPSDKLWTSTCEGLLIETRGEDEMQEIMDKGITSDMLRTQVMAQLLPAAVGTMPPESLKALTQESSQAMSNYLSHISKVIGARTDQEIMPKFAITQIEVEKNERGWVVSAVVTSLAPAAAEVSFTLFGAPGTEIKKSPGNLKMEPWDSTQVQWLIEGSKEAEGFPVTIAVEAPDCTPGYGITVLP